MDSTRTLRQQRHYASAASVGVVMLTLTSAMAALSASAVHPACTSETTCGYPKLHAVVKTTVVPRGCNPEHDADKACSTYEIDVINHITITPRNLDSGTATSDSTTTIEPRVDFRSTYNSSDGVGYYKLHVTPKKWTEAMRICKKEGAHLAVINSQKEEGALKNILFPLEKAYIGFRYKRKGGYWETVHGDPLNSLGYVNWEEIEHKTPVLGECGVLYDTGRLINFACRNAFPFICERPG